MKNGLLRSAVGMVLVLMLSGMTVSLDIRGHSGIHLSWLAAAFADDPAGRAQGGNKHPDDPCEQFKNAARTRVGDPIEAGSGNNFVTETDFQGGMATGLSLIRYYNSAGAGGIGAFGPGFGYHWLTEWHRYVYISPLPLQPGSSYARAFTPTGRVHSWNLNTAGQWVSYPDQTSKFILLTDANNGVIGAQIITDDDTVEEYRQQEDLEWFAYFHLTRITTRAGRTTQLTYDANNNPTQVTGPFGQRLTFSYDSDRHVTQMTTPDGAGYSYTYKHSEVLPLGILQAVTYPDGAQRQYRYENTTLPKALTGIIDENGKRVATWSYSTSAFKGYALSSALAAGLDKTTLAYSYSPQGNLVTQVTDARRNVRTYTFRVQYNLNKAIAVAGVPEPICGGQAFTYDAHGFIASLTDWNGNLTRFTHDTRGNETSRTEADGTPLARTTTTVWHPTYRLPTKIIEPHRTTEYFYSSKGNLLARKTTAGGSIRRESFTYNSLGQVLTAQDPRGNVTRFAYNAQGNLRSIQNALGHLTQFPTYDPNGRPLTIIDPNGVKTTLTYDARGRLTSRTDGTLLTSFAYDPAGHLMKVTRPDTTALTYRYDAAYRPIGIADAQGNQIAYSWDAANNLVKTQIFDATNVLTRLQSYAYDAANRLRQMLGAEGQRTTITYDAQGNQTSVADPLGHKTQYSYDSLDRLVRAVDPAGRITTYGYDASDRLTSVTDPRGLVTTYAWNGFDDLLSLVSPDSGKTKKTYDAAGNVLTVTDARGKVTQYVYDALNRPTRATFADGTGLAWQYDQGAYAKGRLTKLTDGTGTTSYSYDANGQVTRQQQTIGSVTRTLLYGYDAHGRLASLTYPSGKRIDYRYDTSGQVTRLDLAGSPLIKDLTYTPFGGVTGWVYRHGGTYRRTLDLDDRIAALAVPAENTLTLSYDPASRVIGIKNNLLPEQTLGYDALGRLTTYAHGQQKQTYRYDADGNRLSAILRNGPTTKNLAYSYAAASNRLLKIAGDGTETFDYAADGATTRHTTPSVTDTFSYDARGRLVQAQRGSLVRTYGINGLGQRVLKHDPAKPANDHLFVYDRAGHLIGEYGPTGQLIQETVWLGDLPVATLRPAGIFYIAPDHLGAPYQITNGTRQVVWRWDRDPFGNGTPAGALAYNLRFPGQYYDAETGLHYNYLRDYDPKLGRYVDSDPIGLVGGLNTYAYALNNPISLIDFYGLNPCDDIDDEIKKLSKDIFESTRQIDAEMNRRLTIMHADDVLDQHFFILTSTALDSIFQQRAIQEAEIGNKNYNRRDFQLEIEYYSGAEYEKNIKYWRDKRKQLKLKRYAQKN